MTNVPALCRRSNSEPNLGPHFQLRVQFGAKCAPQFQLIAHFGPKCAPQFQLRAQFGAKCAPQLQLRDPNVRALRRCLCSLGGSYGVCLLLLVGLRCLGVRVRGVGIQCRKNCLCCGWGWVGCSFRRCTDRAHLHLPRCCASEPLG